MLTNRVHQRLSLLLLLLASKQEMVTVESDDVTVGYVATREPAAE